MRVEVEVRRTSEQLASTVEDSWRSVGVVKELEAVDT